METTELRPAISWPDRYRPGTTDNFVSNEVIVAGPELRPGIRFNFSAFGYPPTHTTVTEAVAPGPERPGRLTYAGPHLEWLDGLVRVSRSLGMSS